LTAEAASRWAFRRVLAVLDADANVAIAAADLASECGARLALVQTWTAPVVFWGLGSPAALHCGASREAAMRDLEAAADRRVRMIACKLEYSGPLEFRCVRGRVATVACRAARSGVYDAVVVRDRLALRHALAARTCNSDLLPGAREYRVLTLRG
jgi:hypothetical protein